MRFGIMTMQLNELIPAGKPPNEIMGELMNFSHAKLAEKLFNKGFNPIELGGDLAMFLPQSFNTQTLEELLELKDARGVQYTMHLPLWSVETSTPQQHVRHGSAQALVDIIKTTLPLKVERYVIHATGALASEFTAMSLPEVGKSIILRQFQAGALESLQFIIRETGIDSRLLAVETVEFPFDLTWELVEQANTSMCLDVGHVLSGFAGPVELFEVLDRVMPRLGEVHLHDSPYWGKEGKVVYHRDHSVLGTGDLDVWQLLKRIQEAAPQTPFIFELTLDEAIQSMNFISNVAPFALT